MATTDTQKELDPKSSSSVASNAEDEDRKGTDDNVKQVNDNQSNNDENQENSDFSDVEDPSTGESDLSEEEATAKTALAQDQGMLKPQFHTAKRRSVETTVKLARSGR